VVGPTPLGPGAEFDLIRRFVARFPAVAAGVLVGPGDDCAILEGGLAISTDMSVEDVHFRRAWLAPREIGWRAAASALSDLAAVAASPIAALVSLGAPESDAGAYSVEVMEGVAAAVTAAGAVLVGGDLVRSPAALVLDVVVLGRAEPPVLRSGARPGDELWVTGRLGAAGAAVRDWSEGRTPAAEARAAFARPVPRIAEARWLADRAPVSAMLDLSDGIGSDAGHLAAASRVAIELLAASIPVHPAAADRGADEALRLALDGGEDSELCFTAPAGTVGPLQASFRERFGLPLTRVGGVRDGRGLTLLREGRASPLRASGFRHFHEGAW